MRFGRLLVVSECGGRVVLCQCDCGTTKRIRKIRLTVTVGPTRSCGCLRVDANRKRLSTHGQSCSKGEHRREYRSWRMMLNRCLNPNATGFNNYGGRGITVCERWRKFENFLADMGPRPAGKSIDRYPDNDGNYEPGNCRWATRQEQNLNTRTTKNAARYGGFTIRELAQRCGKSIATLRHRLKSGMSIDEAISRTVGRGA